SSPVAAYGVHARTLVSEPLPLPASGAITQSLPTGPCGALGPPRSPGSGMPGSPPYPASRNATFPPWQRAAARALDLLPPLGGHELRPAPVELAMVALAEAVIAGPGLEVHIIALMAQSHLHIQRIAAGDHPPAGLGTLLPVVHVVLLEGA